MTTGFAIPVTRGCGRRVVAGVYLESASSPSGLPIEAFLMDAPVPLPPERTFSRQGVSIEQDHATGIWHVYDWVGSANYPNVADFVEEARRYGVSRRADQMALPYEYLTEKSRLILIHERAVLRAVSDARPVDRGRVPFGPSYQCPKRRFVDYVEQVLRAPVPQKALATATAHEPGGTLCAGMWWEDLESSTVTPVAGDATGKVTRAMPAGFAYEGYVRRGKAPAWAGFFLSIPIGRIVVVRDPKHDTHLKKLDRLRKAQLLVDLVDE